MGVARHVDDARRRRGAARGSSRLVSRNGPRWFTASMVSMPSLVSVRDRSVTPALLTSTPISSVIDSISATARRTSAWSPRSQSTISVFAPGTEASMSAFATSARSRSRHTRMVRCPAAARPRAVSSPMPEFAPVTIAVESELITTFRHNACRQANRRGRLSTTHLVPQSAGRVRSTLRSGVAPHHRSRFQRPRIRTRTGDHDGVAAAHVDPVADDGVRSPGLAARGACGTSGVRLDRHRTRPRPLLPRLRRRVGLGAGPHPQRGPHPGASHRSRRWPRQPSSSTACG